MDKQTQNEAARYFDPIKTTQKSSSSFSGFFWRSIMYTRIAWEFCDIICLDF